jgi:hypothetical protein
MEGCLILGASVYLVLRLDGLKKNTDLAILALEQWPSEFETEFLTFFHNFMLQNQQFLRNICI